MHRLYFNDIKKAEKEKGRKVEKQVPTLNAKPDSRTRVTSKNLTLEEFKFLTCYENQVLWAHLNISKKCVMFHR